MFSFEFMDQDWVPQSIRLTLREILECGNGTPFRGYYGWVAENVDQLALDGGHQTLVELGAGTAPITRRLASDFDVDSRTYVPCDNNPDSRWFKELEEQFPNRVKARHDPVDFSQPHAWKNGSLLFLSATFHHIPPQQRTKVLASLLKSGRIVIFEPLRKNLVSLLFCILSVVPALILPLWYLNRPGRLRRLVWCWLVPVAPLMFVWDGWISCLRQWTAKEWAENVAKIPGAGQVSVRSTLFCQRVELTEGASTVRETSVA